VSDNGDLIFRHSACALDVKNMQQAPREFVNSQDQVPYLSLQRIRRWLECAVIDFHNIANCVNEQAHRTFLGTDHDIHRRRIARPWWQRETLSQVNCGHDLAPKVHETCHGVWGQWNVGRDE